MAAATDQQQTGLVDLAPAGSVRRGGDAEGGTWLDVDLGGRFPVHSVSFGPGDDGGQTVARLAFSSDGQAWSEPEGVQPADGPGGGTRTLRVPAAAAWTRHIRVSPAPGGPLHVWCEQAAFDLIAFRRALGVRFNILHEHAGAVLHTSYSFVSAERSRSRALVGIALLENGAFGNCLVQHFIAISVARALNLKYVKVPVIDRSQVVFLKERLTCEGITFVPAGEPLPDDGYFLSGMYFDAPFQPIIDLGRPLSMRETVHTYIRRVFNGLPPVFPEKPVDQLIVHIRSGDIFSTWIDPNYPQPPLAFYRMVIARLLEEGRIGSVKLVFENRANPVIPALEAHIVGLGLPIETQSGALADDVAAIANGRYLVFGFGSFGPGVCHLSERVDQVFYFSCNWPQGFQSIETVGKAVEVRDVGGGYMKIGDWTNSDAQRRLMIDYPEEKLAFDDRL